MTTGLKILISSFGVVGVGGTVATPLTLWQAGYLLRAKGEENSVTTTFLSNGSELNSAIPSVPKTVSDACVVNNKSEWNKTLNELSITKEDYTAITCNATDTVLKDKWTALLPNGVFDELTYSVGETFEMKTTTNTTSLDSQERYKTTFSSEALDDRVITGEWGATEEANESSLENEIYKVKVEEVDDYGPIYLVLPKQNTNLIT